VSSAELQPGVALLVFLREPKERMWGRLVEMRPEGVLIRGLDLATFDDWLHQEAYGGEQLIGPATAFYPMHRIERLEIDETIGPVTSCSDRFAAAVGRSVCEAIPLPLDCRSPSGGRRRVSGSRRRTRR
jgi:hypothetical protein